MIPVSHESSFSWEFCMDERCYFWLFIFWESTFEFFVVENMEIIYSIEMKTLPSSSRTHLSRYLDTIHSERFSCSSSDYRSSLCSTNDRVRCGDSLFLEIETRGYYQTSDSMVAKSHWEILFDSSGYFLSNSPYMFFVLIIGIFREIGFDILSCDDIVAHGRENKDIKAIHIAIFSIGGFLFVQDNVSEYVFINNQRITNSFL